MQYMDIDEYDGDVEKIAQAVRASWLIPKGPIKNLTNAIENAGAIIIPFDPETRLIDALSFLVSWNAPFIFCKY